jgi:hypothetical protein
MKKVLLLLGLACAVSLVMGCEDSDSEGCVADCDGIDDGSGCNWNFSIDENDPDVISGASGSFSYSMRPGDDEPISLVYSVSEMEEVLSMVAYKVPEDRTEAEQELAKSVQFVISTVQCDGSPNISSIFPAVVNEEVVLLTNASSLTRDSILATKYARTYFRVYNPVGTIDPFDNVGSAGNRMLLKLIEDEQEVQSLYEEFIDNNPVYDYEDLSLFSCMFMRVVTLYPLG